MPLDLTKGPWKIPPNYKMDYMEENFDNENAIDPDSVYIFHDGYVTPVE